MNAVKLSALLSICVAMDAASAQSVTYDYTGTVTEVVGTPGSLAIGSNVSGTYTFDLAAGIPALQVGTVGDPNGLWSVSAYGGVSFSLPVPSAFVFSDTLVGGGYSFTSSATSPTSPYSSVNGYGPSYGGGIGFFQGAYFDNFADGSSTESAINLYGAGVLPYDASGLPVLTHDPDSFSVVETNSAGNLTVLQYTVDSLTLVSASPPVVAAVPETSSYVWMLFGLSLVSFIGYRKKRMP